jgi:hypothetical protein
MGLKSTAALAFALLVLVGTFAPLPVRSESIDDIIHRHWLQLKQRVETEGVSGTFLHFRAAVRAFGRHGPACEKAAISLRKAIQ